MTVHLTKPTLIAVLRKGGRDVDIGGQLDPRSLEPIVTAWTEKRPLLRGRLMHLITTANGHILAGSHDNARKNLREAIRIVTNSISKAETASL